MRLISSSVGCCCLLLALAGGACAEGRVELEIMTEEGFPATETQKWYRTLTDLNLGGLRIRAGRPGEKSEVVTEKRGGTTVYRVTGILTAKNELWLPGGKFSLRDTGRIAAWVNKLREGGPGGGPAKGDKPFGLTDDDFQRLHQQLARPVDFSTKGLSSAEAAARIIKSLDLPVEHSAGAKTALAAADPVAEDLQGLGSGTALAYVLRPAGLGLLPQRGAKGELRALVGRPSDMERAWPIGLPADDERDKVLPKLLEFLTLEIDDIPLPEVLEALGERLEAPMLLDYNALVTRKIDPQKISVSLPSKRMAYSIALRQVLGKARLKSSLRVDEAGKPFMWITTMIPVE